VTKVAWPGWTMTGENAAFLFVHFSPLNKTARSSHMGTNARSVVPPRLS
jgi:hypothetical protein